MYEGVDHRREEGRSTGHPLYSDPPQDEHSAVMVDVQERQLLVFLTQNEEHSVDELNKFRNVIPPNRSDHLETKEQLMSSNWPLIVNSNTLLTHQDCELVCTVHRSSYNSVGERPLTIPKQCNHWERSSQSYMAPRSILRTVEIYCKK